MLRRITNKGVFVDKKFEGNKTNSVVSMETEKKNMIQKSVVDYNVSERSR